MEKFSLWISLGTALVVVVSVLVFAKLHSANPTRPVRDMNPLMVIAPYKYDWRMGV